ncbi:hypothetical protein J5N97_010427 [Dioscorea zingiberensis]|uniref:Uncharacterized protein n=1 Tax=Dioscorea zingiberensis TaxID=325984 RepID=A0A9D5HNL5_9LILI|nr:hypothetical protein J5N97_010427 [Dioscorea zingiberensis]
MYVPECDRSPEASARLLHAADVQWSVLISWRPSMADEDQIGFKREKSEGEISGKEIIPWWRAACGGALSPVVLRAVCFVRAIGREEDNDPRTSSAIGGKPTHTVTASFETAFEVDKEVAAAIKKAFIQLASCPSSSNKEEFRILLLKISQNLDSIKTDQEISEVTSECEFDLGPELNAENVVGDVFRKSDIQMKETREHDKVYSSSPLDLVTEILDKLKCLQEDQLTSLAVIVATYGLNVAILEVDGGKDHGMETIIDNSSGSVIPRTRTMSSLGTSARRCSSVTKFIDEPTRSKDDNVYLKRKLIIMCHTFQTVRLHS